MSPHEKREAKKLAKAEKKDKVPKGKKLSELCAGFYEEAKCPTDKCAWRLPTSKECKPTKAKKGPKAEEQQQEVDVCNFEICGVPAKPKKGPKGPKDASSSDISD